MVGVYNGQGAITIRREHTTLTTVACTNDNSNNFTSKAALEQLKNKICK